MHPKREATKDPCLRSWWWIMLMHHKIAIVLFQVSFICTGERW